MATSELVHQSSGQGIALAFDELAERQSPTRKIAEKYRYLGVSESDTEIKFAAIQQVLTSGDTSYRHKHNFDQIRLVIEGEMRLGKTIVAGPGDVVYFPESVMYGPTTYDDGLMFLLQWPGASDEGFYLHYEDVARGLDEMRELGGEIDFDRGGVWKYSDGRLDDVWEALGQHVLGREVVYADPRYGDVVVLRSSAFTPQPVAMGTNVGVKHLGFLNETGPNIKVLDFGENSLLRAGKAESQQLWTSFEGTFEYRGKSFPPRSMLYFPPGAERDEISSESGAKLLVMHLSRKGLPSMPFTEF